MSEEHVCYGYTEQEFKALEEALEKTNLVCYGRPDQFQYYQNELSKTIANFLLKPYWRSKKMEDDEE